VSEIFKNYDEFTKPTACRRCKRQIPPEDVGMSLVDICTPCLDDVHAAGSEEELARRDALASVNHPIVFYHDGCITHDGWMSALLAKLRWPDADLVPVQYGQVPPWRSIEDGSFASKREQQVAGRDVLVVDFSWDRATLCDLRERARSLLVLDHHKTAAQNLAGLPFCVFDMERSGAGLALDYFFPGARESLDECADEAEDVARIQRHPGGVAPSGPHGLVRVRGTKITRLALMIEDYDLWRFRDLRTRAVGIFLETVEKVPGRWDHDALPAIEDMAEQGRTLLRYRAGLVESIARNAYPIRLPDGSEALAVNSPLFKNEVADLLLRRDPEILSLCRRPGEVPEAPAPGLACLSYYRHEDGFFVCSLRSAPGGVDCSKVAQMRGGGGHERSAGWRAELSEHEDAGFLFGKQHTHPADSFREVVQPDSKISLPRASG
jgi:uncharacterized protein